MSLILDDIESGFSGRGFQLPPASGAEEYLFSVVSYDSLWWTTLVHEVGHNMGLAHDRDNDESTPASKSYSYSHGYRDPVGGFGTVMSYRTGCAECRWQIPHFSNKQVRWEGAPTGNPAYPLACGDGVTTGPHCGRKTGSNRANCSRSLNNTREFYATVRPCEVDCRN